MDKTSARRQQRYRKQIATGKRKRLQVILDRSDSDTLNKICSEEGVTKTEFISRAIEQWSENKGAGNDADRCRRFNETGGDDLRGYSI